MTCRLVLDGLPGLWVVAVRRAVSPRCLCYGTRSGSMALGRLRICMTGCTPGHSLSPSIHLYPSSRAFRLEVLEDLRKGRNLVTRDREQPGLVGDTLRTATQQRRCSLRRKPPGTSEPFQCRTGFPSSL